MTTELVEVAEYDLLPEAEVARLALAGQGIPAFLRGGELVSMEWLYANAVGNIRLMVPADRAEEALALLEKAKPAEGTHACPACDGVVPTGATNCPSCHWPHEDESQPTVDSPTLDSTLTSEPIEPPGPSRMAWLRSYKSGFMLILLLIYGAPVLLGLTVVFYDIIRSFLASLGIIDRYGGY